MHERRVNQPFLVTAERRVFYPYPLGPHGQKRSRRNYKGGIVERRLLVPKGVQRNLGRLGGYRHRLDGDSGVSPPPIPLSEECCPECLKEQTSHKHTVRR